MHGASGSKARIQAPVSEVVAQTWTIPGNRMKADRALRVPQDLDALRRDPAARVAPDRWRVLRLSGPPSEAALVDMVSLMALRRMGRGDITTHGFRSSFRDWAEERTHVPRAACGAALAHTVRDNPEVSYRRIDLFEKHLGLMHAWDRHAINDPARIVSIGASV